jgi:hypothetical protein
MEKTDKKFKIASRVYGVDESAQEEGIPADVRFE